MLKMMFDALTNAGKQVTSNIAKYVQPAIHKKISLLIGPYISL